MLHHGTYRPSGRGETASEYLLATAQAGEFPLVNAPVDVNNAVSLLWGYPASIFDAANSGWELLLRRGMPARATCSTLQAKQSTLRIFYACARGWAAHGYRAAIR